MTPTPQDATLAAIAGVSQDVRDLRVDLTGRLDQMVTRNEHLAEIRRIDAEAARTRDALSAHETQADHRLTAIQQDIEDEAKARAEAFVALASAMAEADNKRETAKTAAAERRKADRRWVAGWVVCATGAVAGLPHLFEWLASLG